LQYTIESRELTHDRRHELHPTTVEARDPDEAISRFVDLSNSELVSFSAPRTGQESIGTVRKDESVFLVRVYQA